MAIIYVQDCHGKPLVPTMRGDHVRRLLGSKQARVVCSNPFTIRLMYEVDPCAQGLILGIDPGRTNIGITVATAEGTCQVSASRPSSYLPYGGTQLLPTWSGPENWQAQEGPGC